jgi:large subunit ribosomal protein L21e
MGNQRARSRGLRHGTRNLFSRGHREHGTLNTTTYLRTFRVGDYVDIKVNSAQQKGMPYLQYQGKTGIVWNVTPRAVGVEINKTIGGRIARKRIHVRIEHVQHSRCREDFIARRATNDKAHHEAKLAGKKIVTKRAVSGAPRDGFEITNVKTELLTPIPYDIVREGIKY